MFYYKKLIAKRHNIINQFHKNKFFALFLVITLLVVGIFPYGLMDTTYADGDPGFRITSAEFKYNGQSLPEAPATTGPFEDGDIIEFTYNWQIDNSTDILPGANTISLTLPDVFPLNAEASGPMNDSNNTPYGTYDVHNRVLTFTFDEDAAILSNVVGGATFSMSFDFENIIVSEPYTLTLPITQTTTKTYSLLIEPETAAPAIVKSGSALTTSNTKWTIDANMNLADSDTIVIIDQLDSRLNFVPSTLNIYPLRVLTNGTYEVSGAAIDSANYSVNYVPSINNTPHALSININAIPGDVIPNAYRIIYEAVVNPDRLDFSQANFIYTNTASLNGSSSSANVTINGGSILTKSEFGTASSQHNPSTVSWELVVNGPGYPLTSARVEDVIPLGLNFNLGADLVILDENGIDITANPSPTKTYDAGTRTLTLDFGDLSAKRTVRIQTSIDPSTILAKTTANTSSNTNSYYSMSYANTAKLYQTQNAVVNETSKSSTINTKVGKLVYKTSSPSISYDAAKYIDWNLYVNLSGISTGTTTVTDLLDSKQTLPVDLANIHVFPVTMQSNGTLLEGAEITTGFTKSFDGADPTHKFSIVFDTPITSGYVIKYRSQIDAEDFVQTSFTNTGTIGIGSGVSYTGTESETIANLYTKTNQDNSLDVNNTTFDYTTKTFDWVMTVNPIREEITALEVADTFTDGLKMNQAHFDALLIKRAGVTLIKNVDYTIDPTLVSGVIKGFTIKFAAGSTPHVVNQALYTIEYQTVVDEATLSSSGNLNYANSVIFRQGAVTVLSSITTVPVITSYQQYNGNKSGSLDLTNKQLTWQINLNYMAKDLSGLILTDTMEVDGNGSGQKLVLGSIKIYKDTVDASGNLKAAGTTLLTEAEVASAGILITEQANGTAFTVNFSGAMNEPYRIVYKTDMVGISRTSYTNTAVTNKGESYTATVSHAQGLTFVDKTGARAGDFVNWQLTVNQGKSTINNLVVNDQLNEGLLLVENSFSLTQNGNPLTFTDYFTVTVNARALASDPQSFVLTAKVPILDTMVIGYQTEIIEDYIVSNSFSNVATITGQNVVTGTRSKTSTIIHNIMESNGWAVGQLGSFTLRKVNEQGLPLQGAKFELYKGLTLIGPLTTDVNGEIHVIKLKYATYTLKEIEAPTGYQLDSVSQNIVINDNADKIVNWTNDLKRTIEIKKVRKGNVTQMLSGAVFEIKSGGNLISTVTTGNDGTAVTQVPYGTYVVTEKTAPPSYIKSNEEKTIIISEGDLDEDLNLKQTYSVTFENELIPEPNEPAPVPTTEKSTEATTEPTSEGSTESSTEPSEPSKSQETTEKTVVDKPKEGKITVPIDSVVTIKETPTNGKIEIDENGNWTYTPDPGFKGKDKFEISLTDPDGNEEIFIIEIEIEDVPLGSALPKTGQLPSLVFETIGLLLTGIGLMIRRNK